jgi:DNA-binding YbaB/EbfC family protein
MEEQQAELETKEFEGTAGGGVVSVKVSGKKEVVSVKLAPEAVDPDDVETLEDLVVAALNEAFKKVDAEQAGIYGNLGGGMGGLGSGLF